MTLDEFDGVVRKLRDRCENTLADTTLMDKKLALIADLKTNVTPLTTPTGFGETIDKLVEEASEHAQRIVGSLVESPAIYLDNVQRLEKNLIAINGEIARKRGV
jgi:hypothetical protein